MTEGQQKHLGMIQEVVKRLAGNSFAYKGWAITIVAALFALGAKEANATYILVGLLPALAFWGLDAYYLRQERLFRALYDGVRKMGQAEWEADPFTMNTLPYVPVVKSWLDTVFSKTIAGLYVPLVVVVFVVAAIAWIAQVFAATPCWYR